MVSPGSVIASAASSDPSALTVLPAPSTRLRTPSLRCLTSRNRSPSAVHHTRRRGCASRPCKPSSAIRVAVTKATRNAPRSADGDGNSRMSAGHTAARIDAPAAPSPR